MQELTVRYSVVVLDNTEVVSMCRSNRCLYVFHHIICTEKMQLQILTVAEKKNKMRASNNSFTGCALKFESPSYRVKSWLLESHKVLSRK